MRFSCTLSLFLLLLFAPALRAGFEFNDNFTVLTPPIPTQQEGAVFARQVLTEAEKLRREIAVEWLGEELPPGVGQTTINVTFSDSQDSGLTWAKDDPSRKHHMLYLTTSPERAVGTTLAHEMAHVVLATRFPHPDRLSAWLEEGIASRYDDDERSAKRRSILAWFERTGNWPRLQDVLFAENIRATEPADYAVAASLTEFLITRGGADGKRVLLAFGEQLATSDFEAALAKHYGIRSIDDLYAAWQNWLRASGNAAASQQLTKRNTP